MRTFPGVRLGAFKDPSSRAEIKKLVDTLRQVNGGLARSLAPGQAPAANPTPSQPQQGGSTVPQPNIGDLLYGDLGPIGNVWARLSIGAPGQVLQVIGSKPRWNTTPVSAAWPIGSVFISVVATNPSSLLGFASTWTAFGTGRVLVGIDPADTNYDGAGNGIDTVEETGGSKTRAAAGTNANESAHTHDYNTVIAHTHTITDPGHSHLVGSSFDSSNVTGSGNEYAGNDGTALSGDATTSITIDNTGSASGTTAGGSAHTHTFTGSATSVVQPYITVYMWKRTA